MNRLTNILLPAGLALCLLQVWLPGYYLTGDGPCHLYNARIIHDLWTHANVECYSRFFSLSYQPNPNWLSSFALASLMFIVNGAVAEKIFLSVYVIVYLVGFYLLLRSIDAEVSFLLFVALVFVFPHTLAKGFYNFSFSVGFYFWVVWSWLRLLERRTLVNAMRFLFFAALVFFTHLLAFGFALFTCASLVISYSLAANASARDRFTGIFLMYTALLAVLVAPFLVLMRWFTEKEGGMQMQLTHHFYRIVELAQFKYLVNVTHREDYIALITGVSLLILLGIASIIRMRSGRVSKYDGFLLSLLFALVIYLFLPESFLGRLILISMRAQLFVFILVVCCAAYMIPSQKMKNAFGFIFLGCFVVLSIIRVHCREEAAAGVRDYISVGAYLKSNAVVLPLDFAPEGKDEQGNTIDNGCYLFAHASQYLGAEKPLIMLDNYEANIGYFPLRWIPETNPYLHLSTGDGIEANPPSADIEHYKQASGVTVDYVLLWCFDSSALQHDQFRRLYAQINSGYHLVYISPSRRTVLYEKN